MNSLNTVLSHPLFVAMASLVIGSGLFGWIKYQSERYDARRDKALVFLEDVSLLINNSLSHLIHATKNYKHKTEKIEDFGLGALFTNRLLVRTKSRAYLQNDAFWQGYESILFQLQDIERAVRKAEDVKKMSEVAENATKQAIELAAKFDINIPVPRETLEPLESPWLEILEWLCVLWTHTDKFLSQALSEAVSGPHLCSRSYRLSPKKYIERHPSG